MTDYVGWKYRQRRRRRIRIYKRNNQWSEAGYTKDKDRITKNEIKLLSK